MEIRESILQKLTEIEQREAVTILHAVESGSRSWGFASPDSDYDVRFVYVRRESDYLRLEKQRDVIEWELNDVYDLSGWDLTKTLRLLHSSNPTLHEWCNSPVIYRTTDFFDRVKETAKAYFSVRTGAMHYLGMAKSNYRNYLQGETVRLKKYFYVLRPIFACCWVLSERCAPPMAFSELTDAAAPQALRPLIAELTARKMQTPELGEGGRIPELGAYIEESLAELEEILRQTPPDAQPPWAPLNRLFLDGIRFGETK